MCFGSNQEAECEIVFTGTYFTIIMFCGDRNFLLLKAFLYCYIFKDDASIISPHPNNTLPISCIVFCSACESLVGKRKVDDEVSLLHMILLIEAIL